MQPGTSRRSRFESWWTTERRVSVRSFAAVTAILACVASAAAGATTPNLTLPYPVVHQARGAVSTAAPARIVTPPLDSGRYVIVAKQDGIDLQLGIDAPAGTAAVFNTITDRIGPEIGAFILRTPAAVELTVAAPDQTGARGHYGLSLYRAGDDALWQTLSQVAAAGRIGTDPSGAARRRANGHLDAALQALGDDGPPLLRALLRYWMGMNHYWPLQIDEGEEDFRAAAEQFDAAGAPALAAMARADLAATIMEAGRYDEAEALYTRSRQALTQAQAHHGVAYVDNLHGLLDQYRGRYSSAQAKFQAAETAFAAAGDRVKAAQARGNLALVAEQRARLLEARTLGHEALAMLPPGESPYVRSILLTNLAHVERRLGNANRSLALLQDAGSQQRAAGDLAGVAWTLSGMAAVHRDMNDVMRAMALQTEAVALRRDRPEAGGLFDAVLRLGDDHLAIGLRRRDAQAMAQARSLFREAEALASNARQRIRAALALARGAREAGEPDIALGHVQAALEFAQGAEDVHERHLALLERGLNPRCAGEARRRDLQSVVAHLDGGEPGTSLFTALAALGALATTPEQAAAYDRRALAALSALRERATNPALVPHLTERAYPVIERRVAQLVDDASGEADVVEALELALRHQRTALAAQLNEISADPDVMLADEDRTALTAAREQFVQARESYLRARDGGDRDAVVDAQRAVMRALAARDAVGARIRERHPVYAEVALPEALAVRDLQATLRDRRAAALFYFLGSGRGWGWRVSGDAVQVWALPGRDAVREQVVSLVGAVTGGQTVSSRALFDALAAASERFLPPNFEAGRYARVLIVPDGALALVPFAALRPDGREYLIEHAAVEVLSTTASRPAARSTARAKRLVAVAGGGLAGARREAEWLTSRYRGRARLLTVDDAADRLGALQSGVEQADIVHFATHAWVDPEVPALSGLALGDAGESGGDLSLAQVHDLRLAARLVVLGACETALGRLVHGEGAMSLIRAFHIAGAQRVLATHWRVADRYALAFAERFYDALATSPDDEVEALRTAQLRLMREIPQARHPYHWAAYSLSSSGLAAEGGL